METGTSGQKSVYKNIGMFDSKSAISTFMCEKLQTILFNFSNYSNQNKFTKFETFPTIQTVFSKYSCYDTNIHIC